MWIQQIGDSQVHIYLIKNLFHKFRYADCSLFSDASGMVRLWHYTSGKVVKSFNDGRQLLSVAYSPDSTKIITSGTEPAIHMYDAQTLEKVHVFQAGYV